MIDRKDESIKKDYYSAEELFNIFKKNGFNMDEDCSSFKKSIERYDKELYKEVVVKKRKNIFFDKKFIEEINFDLLRRLADPSGRIEYGIYLKYRDSSDLSIIIDNYYSGYEVYNIFKKNGLKTETSCYRFSRAIQDYDKELYEEVVTIIFGRRFFKKKFIEKIDFDLLQMLSDSSGKVKYMEYLRCCDSEEISIINNYYSGYEVYNIFKKNGLNISKNKFNSSFSRAIRKHDEELYKEVVTIISGKIFFKKKFIKKIDFDLLRMIKNSDGVVAYKAWLEYCDSDETLIKDDYYSAKEVCSMLKKYGLNTENTCSTFKQAIRNYDKKLYKDVVKTISNKVFFKKKFIEEIDFSLLKMLSDSNGVLGYSTCLEYRDTGEISVYRAGKLIDVREANIHAHLTNVKDYKYIINNRDGKSYVKFEYVLEWREFKKNVVGIQNIARKVLDEISSKIRCRRPIFINQISKMQENGEFEKFGVVPEYDTPFRTNPSNELYIKKEYASEVYKVLKNKFIEIDMRVYGSQTEKFQYDFSFIDTKYKKHSFKEFSEFVISRISMLSKACATTYIDIAQNMEKLNKEIWHYTDEEIKNINENLKTKTARSEFTLFLKELKKKKDTKYSNYDFDKTVNVKETNRGAYTEEQYLRFGFLVWSDSHIWYESYMEKALKTRLHASVWLYAVLHYICAWRAKDMLEQFPRPDIHMEPKVFLEQVKNKELKDEVALNIVEQVNLKISLEEITPNKTRNVANAPSLVLQIPDSVYIFLGTLIGIVEAHTQLSRNQSRIKGLISSEVKKRKQQIDFFGEEFIDIFGDESFNNIRAVKNYENLVCRKADKEKIGTGYILASIARSHKFTVNKLSETTKIYLKYYKDMEDSEILLRELFERGICSFAPYMLVKMIKGEDVINKLSSKEITKEIKGIALGDAYDTEMFLQAFDGGLENAKAVVVELIKHAVENDEDPKDVAKKALVMLSYDEASSKEDKLPCMITAQGRNCIYPKRKNCIGCGYEVYLKSCLSELGNRINKAKQQALSSKTSNSKKKNILMVQQVFVPIVKEILITLKEVHKIDNLDEYKQLIQ